ncbi:hypothetical protein ANN_23970 [Periplaneta americana]|uniref:Uncharacterized protein n=1 Tax=Periplaneta americana TaxID=6978 RepID=A0ABQ8S233_PERAM|nr:hypothetical protein ANN_23970 [Periplaneta americana]
MAGLCKGGNELPGSLKAFCKMRTPENFQSDKRYCAAQASLLEDIQLLLNQQSYARWGHGAYLQSVNGSSLPPVFPIVSFRDLVMFHGSLGPLTCPRDFFLCEYLKARVYEDKPRILDELKDTVRQHITQINRDPLERIEDKMVVGRKTKKVNVRILNEAVEQMDSFKSSNMSCCQEVKRRMAMAKEAFNSKRSIFCEPLEKELRKRLVKCFVWNVAIYGAETWTLRRSDNAGEMNPGSSTECYPAFARIELRKNPGKNLNQVTCPDRDSNPGHLVSRPDALTVTPQVAQLVEQLATDWKVRGSIPGGDKVNGPKVHSAFYKMEYRVFPVGKRWSERGADHTTSF